MENIEVYKRNLDKSLEVNSILKRNNELIRKKYQQLKEENIELSNKVAEAKTQAQLAYQSKEAVERDCESLYKQWNEHVKQQQEEFQAIKAQMVPSRELEMLRISMAEELEFPHRKRITELNNQLNNFRDQYHEEHRKLELLKIKYNELEKNSLQDINVIKLQYEKKCNNLEIKNNELQDLVEDTSTIDELRQVQRSNSDLILRNKKLNDIILNITKERDQTIEEYDLYKQSILKANKLQDGKYLLLEQDLKAVENKYNDLSTEYNIICNNKQNLHEKIIKLESIQLSFNDKILSKERELSFISDSCEKRINEIKNNCNIKVDHLAKTLNLLQENYNKLSHQKMEVDEKLKYNHRETTLLIKQNKEEELYKRSKLQDINTNLNEQIESKNHEIIQLNSTIDEQNKKIQLLTNNNDTLKKSINEHQNTFNTHIEQYDVLNEAHNDKITQNEELNNIHIKLKDEHENILKQLNNYQSKHTQLQEEYHNIQQDHLNLMKDIQNERDTHLNTLKDAKSNLKHKEEELNSNFQDITIKDIKKLKKDKNRYKIMSIKLRKKVEHLMKEMEQYDSNQITLIDLKSENNQLSNQLNVLKEENYMLKNKKESSSLYKASISEENKYDTDNDTNTLRDKLMN